MAPNIVFILVDNVGWGDFGAYGGTIPTPRIDKLLYGCHPVGPGGLSHTRKINPQFVPSPFSNFLGNGFFASWCKRGVIPGGCGCIVEDCRVRALRMGNCLCESLH